MVILLVCANIVFFLHMPLSTVYYCLHLGYVIGCIFVLQTFLIDVGVFFVVVVVVAVLYLRRR